MTAHGRLREKVGEIMCGEPFYNRDPEEQADIRKEADAILRAVLEEVEARLPRYCARDSDHCHFRLTDLRALLVGKEE